MRELRWLTEDEKELAYSMAIDGRPFYQISDKLLFTDKMAFHRYCKRDLEFNEELQNARIAAGVHLEDRIFTIADEYLDPQQARVKLECMKTGMSFINPGKYGPKLDISVNQTISLVSALNSAEQRVLIDVTPKLNDSDDLLG